MLLRALAICLLIALAETVHGALRVRFLNPRFGDRRARQLGVFTGSATRERRADIIVSWRSGRQTHIEVKIGDENFDKTFDTCQLLHGKRRPQDWCDAILIPDTSKAAWDEVAEAHVHDDPVDVILWSDVVRGLRKSLWSGRESTAWQVWAWAFCGAVEAQILGLQEPSLSGPGMGELDMLSRWVEVLTLGKMNNYEH